MGAEGMEPLAGDDPTHIAGYQLRARLGAGGMGKVYLAYTPGGRPVALKIMRPEFGADPTFRERFRQVVHRDLKPSNVILAPDGPRVIDFGIARATDASAITGQGMRVGSPQFMAPE